MEASRNGEAGGKSLAAKRWWLFETRARRLGRLRCVGLAAHDGLGE